MKAKSKTPMVLIILDGWGHREDPTDNAIHSANTPVWDALWNEAPHTLISSSGLDVGLPQGQMGNSEVGHMSLGSGRVVYQNITRIDAAIADGSFFQNPAYTRSIDRALTVDGAIHIFGLLSKGGIHSHESHIQSAIELAHRQGAKKIFMHAFLDGRDTPPRSALVSIKKIEQQFEELGCGRIASVCGRYYAMDRDNRWDRIQATYDMLTQGRGEYSARSGEEALSNAYRRDENDEFVRPSWIDSSDGQDGSIKDGDTVLFMNFRSDRARQLTRCFTEDKFDHFERLKVPRLSAFVTTTEYAKDIKAECAFSPEKLSNVFGEYISNLGKTQLRIAETEKYAHVTFFFSGGREELFPGEERSLVPSPNVATYDLQPEMSAAEVTDKLVDAIKSNLYDFIICNYANGDMVGHTGIFDAAVLAVEALDISLGRIVEAINETHAQALITADHGNCEQMQDYESGQNHTQHTTELVPLVYLGNKPLTLRAGAKLADIAPTMLALSGIEIPKEMTGQSIAGK
jgi:2,3-bisphosphoglycerate-independent phosphoglycerate mutase